MDSGPQFKNSPNNLPVLIVDDDPSFLSIVTAFMTKSGWKYEVEVAGQPAIARLRTDPFVAVLLDLNLPDISGIDVLLTIGDFPNAPPVVLMSGGASIHSALEAGQLGAVDFIEKPVRMSDLLARLAHNINRHSTIGSLAAEEDWNLPSRRRPTPNSNVVTEVAELILRIVRYYDDVRTVSDWACLLRLTEKTLAGRCARIGLPAKRTLDLARLLRVIGQRPLGPASLMLDSLDRRTLVALTGRAGISVRELETLSALEFLRKQVLVDNPRLIDCLLRTLPGFEQRNAPAGGHEPSN